VLVFAAALLAFVQGIGTREIWTRDEARTALVIRAMLETGEWSLARMPGGVPSTKPPPLRPWSLERVDEVVIRDTSYVLAQRRAPESS
jgi:4-amino-4-deoxy-L-arabinose transferase-like glycosyltransferase